MTGPLERASDSVKAPLQPRRFLACRSSRLMHACSPVLPSSAGAAALSPPVSPTLPRFPSRSYLPVHPEQRPALSSHHLPVGLPGLLRLGVTNVDLAVLSATRRVWCYQAQIQSRTPPDARHQRPKPRLHPPTHFSYFICLYNDDQTTPVTISRRAGASLDVVGLRPWASYLPLPLGSLHAAWRTASTCRCRARV